MTINKRWTSADLDTLPYDELKRYEIIDGALHVSSPNHYAHQSVCAEILMALDAWSDQSEMGEAVIAPGLIFGDYDDVVPDVVWIRKERLRDGLDKNGHVRVAPELIAEVLTPGDEDERRDREAKLLLYSRCGVTEYWIVNWVFRYLDVYRHEHKQLHHIATLHEHDGLESPLLPGFSCSVASLFERIPAMAIRRR
jgi:Uma2 family endonuclease